MKPLDQTPGHGAPVTEPDVADHEQIPQQDTERAPTATDNPGPATAAAIPVTRPGHLYFLTNWMNLTGVLSSRIIAPRESHAKYYADLLEHTPGWVPLLRQPPTSGLVDVVTAERGAEIPVLIEFPADIVDFQMSDGPVIYCPAVALSQATAIHLRDGRDLKRHWARRYENVRPHDALVKVTPELFDGPGADRPPHNPPPNPHHVDWQRIDRIRGALNAVVVAGETRTQLEAARSLLDATHRPGGDPGLPAWMTWLEIDDHDPDTPRTPPDPGLADHVGFRAAYEELGAQDTTRQWAPSEVLDAVTTRITTADLTAEAAHVMTQNLQRVRSVLNAETEFEPFRSTARALISAKALLLILLRPTLHGQLTWPAEETGADDLTRTTAALLAGRLRGLARESIDLRHPELDDISAAWAVRIAEGRDADLGPVRFTDETHPSLLVGDAEVTSGRPAT